MSDEKVSEEHPAYGMISFSRITGFRDRMFGSAISRHYGYVKMTLRRAVREHDLHTDWYHAREILMEVDLTHQQFAELITTMNVGDGVPCTLRYVPDGKLQKVPELPKYEHPEINRIYSTYKANLKDLGKKFKKEFDNIRIYMADTKNLTKDKREFILRTIEKIEQELGANAEFAVDMFHEAAEKLVTASKSEVEGFISGVIHRTGLKVLQEGKIFPELQAPEEEES